MCGTHILCSVIMKDKAGEGLRCSDKNSTSKGHRVPRVCFPLGGKAVQISGKDRSERQISVFATLG